MAIRYSRGKPVRRTWRPGSRTTKLPSKTEPSKGKSTPTPTPKVTPTPTRKAGYYSEGKYHFYEGNKLYSVPTSVAQKYEREGKTIPIIEARVETARVSLQQTSKVPLRVTRKTEPGTKIAPGLKVGRLKGAEEIAKLRTKLEMGDKVPRITRETPIGTKIGLWTVKDTGKELKEKEVKVDVLVGPVKIEEYKPVGTVESRLWKIQPEAEEAGKKLTKDIDIFTAWREKEESKLEKKRGQAYTQEEINEFNK
ncbi:unnamed protein product, partial [marine sediment metagenome]